MDLRPELLPPKLDSALVARLSFLAASIDGAAPGQWEDWLAEFNRESGTQQTFADFQGLSGGMDHETFVRNLLADRQQTVQTEITRAEYLELIHRVRLARGSEAEQHFWLNFLKRLNPRISDLIYWPGEYFGDSDQSRELSDEEILDFAIRDAQGENAR